MLAEGLRQNNLSPVNDSWFDTLTLNTGDKTAALIKAAQKQRVNLRQIDANTIGLSLDETTGAEDVVALWDILLGSHSLDIEALLEEVSEALPGNLMRKDSFLTHPTFSRYHSETEMLRYLRKLSDKDIALDRAMIPLGSCTMKLNATA